jgi:hypothetical protein
MKTLIVLFVVVLFVLTLRFYLKEQKNKDCKESCSDDKRIVKISRAKKNLHPKININVDRDSRGRFCKKD